MIKNLNGSKLSKTGSHRKAMMRNLATALFQHENITTTLPKAKALVSFSSKLLTAARPGTLAAKRAIAADIKDKMVYKKIFDVLVPRYQGRAGGYARIYRVGTRAGDRAEMAIVKLVI